MGAQFGPAFLRVVLFIAHSLQVQHLDHLVRHLLFVVVGLVANFGGSSRDYGDCVSIEPSVQPGLDDLAVLYRVLLQNFVYILGC